MGEQKTEQSLTPGRGGFLEEVPFEWALKAAQALARLQTKNLRGKAFSVEGTAYAKTPSPTRLGHSELWEV